jgi:hypothetical protein
MCVPNRNFILLAIPETVVDTSGLAAAILIFCHNSPMRTVELIAVEFSTPKHGQASKTLFRSVIGPYYWEIFEAPVNHNAKKNLEPAEG